MKKMVKNVLLRSNITVAQLLLHEHLHELGIETVFEFRFTLERRYRFDLYCERLRIGFEVHGTYKGLHGTRWAWDDLDKLNIAQLLGYRVLQFTNKQVETGTAKAFLAKWLEKG